MDGDFSLSTKDLEKELGKVKSETAEEYLEASDIAELGIQARRQDRQRRRLSKAVKKALTYRTLRYVGRQQTVQRWRPPTAAIRSASEPGPSGNYSVTSIL